MMKRLPFIAAILTAVLAASAMQGLTADAAPVEISPSVKSAFEQTVQKADKGLQMPLRTRFATFTAMQESRRADEEAYRKLRYRNEEELTVLRARVKRVNERRIAALENGVEASRKKYKPLFDAYSAANQQVSVARALGDRKLTALVRAQADALKPAVALARQDIRSREESLRAARAATSKTVKAIRGTLSAADPLLVQIKSERSAVSALSKRISAAYGAFGQQARKRDAPAVLDSLAALIALSGQMADRHKQMMTLENRIASIHAKARAMFPPE